MSRFTIGVVADSRTQAEELLNKYCGEELDDKIDYFTLLPDIEWSDDFATEHALTWDEYMDCRTEWEYFKDGHLRNYGNFDNYIKARMSNIPYAWVDENGWSDIGDLGEGFNSTWEDIKRHIDYVETYLNNRENKDKIIHFAVGHI